MFAPKTPVGSQKESASRMLFLLWGMFAVAQLDRQIMSLLLESIALEFQLSDWHLGLLSGLTFAIIFVVVGFPVAALCAHWNRNNIVAGSVFTWSLFTTLTSFAQNFTQLFGARMAVGAGEAGAVAPAHSLISDLYPEDAHASALSTFATGANVGVLAAALIGGIIGQLWGWRTAFFVAGLPGLIIAVLLYRYGHDPRAAKTNEHGSDVGLFFDTLQHILNDAGLRFACLALTSFGITFFAFLTWMPTLLIRQYDLEVAQVGMLLAFCFGVIGGPGTYLLGLLTDRIGHTYKPGRMYFVASILAIQTILIALVLTLENSIVGLLIYAVSTFFGFAFWGPTFAFIYQRTPSLNRPMATAFFLLSFNLVGMCFGPPLVGLLSDGVFGHHGVFSLGYALLSVKALTVLPILFYILMGRQIAKSV